jgi:hypothetical protein
MANIAKRPDGRWRVRYRDHVGREISRHFARKVDAQRWLDSVTTAVSTGLYVDPSSSRVRVEDWAHKWLETKTNLKPTTRRDYESLLQAHVVPRWGSMTLAEVKHEDITSWLADLSARRLSASRVRAAHVRCRRCSSWLFARGDWPATQPSMSAAARAPRRQAVSDAR